MSTIRISRIFILGLFVFCSLHSYAQTYSQELVKQAKKGDVTSQITLAECYFKGEGVKQDFSEAVKWWRKAAEKGDSNAQYSLGMSYYNGEGIGIDYTEAVKWLEKSALQGNPDGQSSLGYCYCLGNGVEQDYAKAVKWFTLAAEQGEADAQFALGICYLNGNGIEQNYTEMVKWWRKAAAQGHEEASQALWDIGYKDNDTITIGAFNVEGKDENIASNAEGKDSETKIFDVVEDMPMFLGGQNALMDYLTRNLRYPGDAVNNNIEGQVIVRFVVTKDGTISDVTIVKSVYPSLDAEAMRVVKSMPKWIPGRQNGENINVYFTMPITFSL